MNDKEYTYDIGEYTIGVDTNGEDGIGMTVAIIKNGEINFLGNCYGKNARCLDLLIKENQELKSQLKGTTHCFDEEEHEKLKKQLEEWEHHLKCSKEMLDIQGQKGNYDYDEYMLGLYNGMEYIIALFETREPNFISGKDVEFTNNKTQQKEFIKYLEDEVKIYSNTYMGEMLKELEGILQKYKEIIGVKDEKDNN